MDWQPIDSAPKDWTHVLVYDHGEASVCEAYHRDGEWLRANLHPIDEDSVLLEPTHWMPLPAPPRPEGA